jgi:hypothetical protein
MQQTYLLRTYLLRRNIMEKTYLLTRDDYLNLKAAWKKLADAKDIKSSDIIIYNVLRGKAPANGFSATAQGSKHERANDPWFAFEQAKKNALSRMPNGHSVKLTMKWYPGKAEEYHAKVTAAFVTRYGIEAPEELNGQLCVAKPTSPAYMYIFVREDMSAPQQIVQAVHAAQERALT